MRGINLKFERCLFEKSSDDYPKNPAGDESAEDNSENEQYLFPVFIRIEHIAK